jgi:hypothetical protein
MKLREIDSKPVSRSFDNFDKIPIVIEDIGKILVSNNDVVITPANRQKIIEAIRSVYKSTKKYF